MSAAPVPRGERWKPVSGSANMDTAYRQLWNNPAKAYAYICWCKAPFPESDDKEEEDEEEDEDDGCDGGKACLCGKKAEEHPGHKWITTYACRRKFLTQVSMAHFRDPANFGMSTYKYHEGYGMAEVVENLLLDFVEADSNWREQWVVCETLSLFLQTDLAEALLGIDDAEALTQLVRLASRTFLAMLARLERDRRLGPDSEVKSLALIMCLYIKIFRSIRDGDLLQEGKEETVELKAADGSTTKYTFNLDFFDEYILGYAKRHGITLPDVSGDDDDLEELPSQTAEDPWNTAAAFRFYEKEFGKTTGSGETARAIMGGDSHDVTTWTSDQRAAATRNRRDPFSKKEIKALKMGFMLQFE